MARRIQDPAIHLFMHLQESQKWTRLGNGPRKTCLISARSTRQGTPGGNLIRPRTHELEAKRTPMTLRTKLYGGLMDLRSTAAFTEGIQ
ncbi:hypothetical protein PoB_007087100 [Plakobranchus ocellatus]|uniref:Uncharacterized protein n=1 Tax=Plakobranchus ocellatus TaxID=259542 RepID=A0AAV4DK76_9GAST|nr:hypothetical protein PoB_007087100 [Plakobranchus ocellatus]